MTATLGKTGLRVSRFRTRRPSSKRPARRVIAERWRQWDLVASSNAERVDTALATLPANAEGYALDLRREEEIRDLFERLGRFGHLAYAGESLPLGLIGTTDLEAARRAFEIRFWGVSPRSSTRRRAYARAARSSSAPHRKCPPTGDLDRCLEHLRRCRGAHAGARRGARGDPRQRRRARRRSQQPLARHQRGRPLGDVRLPRPSASGRSGG